MMGGVLRRVPLFVQLAAFHAASMMVPALHALSIDAHRVAQAFFYNGVLLLAVLAALAVATARDRSRNITRSHLVALLGAFTILPVMAAMPVSDIVSDTRFLNVYTEMVAAMTTTGGSLFPADRLPETVHLWRAFVAWQGGLVVWVAAVAVLAPLNLGGYEVAEGNVRRHADLEQTRTDGQAMNPDLRVFRAMVTLGPIYLGLTGILWAILTIAGEGATTSLIHAMSTMSTSGISDGTTIARSTAGIGGEVAIAAFLMFALSRQTFSTDMNRDGMRHLAQDRELRIAGMLVVAVTVALFARHWIAAFEVGTTDDVGGALGALWGSAFTVLSFLTTTGFESAHWQAAQSWSGLGTPSVLLLGLAMFGGGVATTAGGVKLLRIYTLYAHGQREMSVLVYPSSVAGMQGRGRRIPSGGIEAAWVFFMLFATTMAGVTLAFTLTGLDFEDALALAVACLTTTGPLAEIVLGGKGTLTTLPDASKVIAAATMVIGRLEVLALFALLNPNFWRD
ncbi:Trk system potassium uptake protein TrkG [Jannaschia rubra]|uniref:Trk system potassium uptake protein TrkG n=2 Tax=Jannaschia rubra TaxID=282197 RepID=A0A0M6XU06_9RHOB|nr:Trk system potassium uptake protein TrkG [Jannaschia rubra]SFG23473.1 trk system potassium uptake protein TrkH [Jannaschia rubra]